MSAVFDWLSNNYGIITTVATVVIALSAAATVWLTRNLVKENRFLRKIGEDPKVIAYLSLDENCVHFFNFTLENVGKGPARNIVYDFNIEERYYGADRVGLTIDPERKPIGFLPQDEKICTFFGNGIGLLGDDKLPPFKVTVEWENLKGNKERGEYELDVKQFLGFTSVSTSPEIEIAKSLKNISKRLDGFASLGSSGYLRFEAREQDKEIDETEEDEEIVIAEKIRQMTKLNQAK